MFSTLEWYLIALFASKDPKNILKIFPGIYFPFFANTTILFFAMTFHVNFYFKISFEFLLRMYEQCRLGRHIPFAKESLKDGILRVSMRYPSTNPGDCDNFLNQVGRHIGDNKSLIARLKVKLNES